MFELAVDISDVHNYNVILVHENDIQLAITYT